MLITKEKTIGEMVADDYRSASVFKSYGIDFCCRGGRTLDEVCKTKGLSRERIEKDLEIALIDSGQVGNEYQNWPLDLLIDYIEKKHHRYVEKRIPELMGFLEKLKRVHGDRHPELIEIENEFRISAGELTAHMKKEELILFPMIRKYVMAEASGDPCPAPHFGTVLNPIEVMRSEHENEGERYNRIADLSNNYRAPEDGCTTYRVAYAMLKEFEEDLHLHIHLENNILFPKAIELEKVLMKNLQ